MSRSITAAHPKPSLKSKQERMAAARRAGRRARMRRRLMWFGIPAVALAGVVVLVVTLSGGGGGATATTRASAHFDGPPAATMLAVGDTIPNWSAPGIRGGTVSWSQFAGTPTLLDIWAPWCPHCQADAPILQRVAKDYPDVKTVTVAIWQDRQPTPTAMDFVEQYGVTQPTAVDDSNETLAKGFGVEGTPTVYAVDRSGKIVAARSGELGEAGYRAFYEQLSTAAE